jgi:D-glycero-alpha-D-manno-heptose-7-phosphate kinase
VGKQDQYIAAYGGLLCQDYQPDESVQVAPLKLGQGAVREWEESLMLFFIGQTRAAATLLADQKQRSESGDDAMTEALHATKALGRKIQVMLEGGQIDQFGALMHEHWMKKRERSAGMSSGRIDQLYGLARGEGGALGGKLVGAGGGGFLLFQTRDRRRLREVMTAAGLAEMDFNFDFDGSVVLLRN